MIHCPILLFHHRVDVVVSPIKSTLLGVQGAAYPLVMGDVNLMKLLSLLRPKVGLVVGAGENE